MTRFIVTERPQGKVFMDVLGVDGCVLMQNIGRKSGKM